MKKTLTTTLLAILICVCMVFGFTSCGNKCDHSYDNACDATCNVCNATREVGAHDFVAADCDTPKTCKVCGKTEGEALGHKPAEDDGDCSTEVKCTVCGEVTTPAGQHTPNVDDGDRKCDNPGCEQLIITASEGLVFTQNTDEDGNLLESYSVTGLGTCTDTDIVIPATYGDKNWPVTTIGESAFAGSALTSITIPDSVTTIGNEAFFGCTALTSVDIGENSQLTTIGDYAFQNSALTSITIPDSVTTIGIQAFNSSALTSVTFGENSTLKMIGNLAFYNCTALTSITIPNSITTIGDWAFASTGLTSVSFGTNSLLTTIGDYAFKNCTALTSVNIPDSVTEIGIEAFAYSGLTSVTIPASVTTIGNNAFSDCSSLTSVTIPASVTTIGDWAFYSTTLTSVYYGGTEADWGDKDKITVGDYAIPDNATVYYYSSDMPTTAGNYWYYENGVPTAWDNPYNPIEVNGLKFKLNEDGESYTVTGLAEGFDGTEVTIPATVNGKPVTAIGEYAFWGCSSLTSVNFGENSRLKTIDSFAFDNCGSLKSMTIPDSVTEIGSNAFTACYDLASVMIPASVETIGNNAFDGCHSLTSVYYCGTDASVWETLSANAEIPDTATVYIYSSDMPTAEGNYWYYDTSGALAFWKEVAMGGAVLTLNEDGESYFVKGLASDFEDTEVNIPATCNGKPVTAINNWAFNGCTSLTSVTIPGSVTSIGDYAFYGCTDLTSVTIGENSQLTTIGNSAFQSTALTSVNIPASVTAIGNMAFYKCAALESVTFGEGSLLTSIGDNAFNGCSSLTSMTFGENNKLTTIGMYAFANTALTSVEIPASVTTIGEGIFIKCTGLKSAAFKGNKLTTISARMFENCSSLTSVTIPDFVTSIGNMAFYNCVALTSVTIPDSVTTIDNMAFYKCTALTSVTIPDSVETIGKSAFYYCSSLTSVYYDGTKSGWDNNVSKGDGAIPGNATVYCWSEGLEFTQNTDEDGNLLDSYSVTGFGDCTDTDVFIPSKYNGKHVTAIGERAFYNCDSLTSVTIPDSVTVIDENAFCFCDSLSSVTIPDSVETIGKYAFQACTVLTSVTFGENCKLQTIDEGAFYGCRSLTSVTIPASVETIGEIAFQNCTALTSVIIPDSVTEIGKQAFVRCALTSVTIPNSVTTIDSGVFGACTALESVMIPATVTEIGQQAFGGCTALKSIYYNGTKSDWDKVSKGNDAIPEGVTVYCWSEGLEFTQNTDEDGNLLDSYSVTDFGDCTDTVLFIPATHEGKPVTAIGDYAFSKFIGGTLAENSACAALTSVMIPNSVTSIGNFAFYSCTALTSVTIPDSVETIGEYVFQGCEALESVTLGENSRLTTIGRQAFNWCKSLTSVTIPDSVTSIGLSAFYGSAVTSIYYEGTESAWAEVEVNDDAIPDIATVYYYSEEKPVGEGNYWHYVDGVSTTEWDD